MSLPCIGQPISWLRLETFALDGKDAAIADHVAQCPACARCLDEIRGDVVALPPLVMAVEPRRKRSWLWWLAPAMAAAAAAMLLLVIIRRPTGERDDVTRVKGLGEVTLGVVRERAGTIRFDVRTFAEGDRWKVMVTCPPAGEAWLDVAVVDAGQVDYPLAPARVACGNKVVVPGAFAITGNHTNLVCVRVSTAIAPPRLPPHPGDDGVACVTLRPE
ncbi:MAG TPA: hypothetical protein VFQ53_29370 [Kofleriaceae bacterium]|nr:hypothetical protein [Kofleriaceae bacterium]